MSTRLQTCMPFDCARPTGHGTRRRPPRRDGEIVRPSQVYRAAVRFSLARMIVIEDLREDGFSIDP